MKKYLLALLIPALLSAETFKAASDFFSVEIDVSPNKLSVLETLSLSLTFTHPEPYKPDLNKIRLNVLDYAGFSESPFTLLNETIQEEPNKTIFTLTLNPQLGGNFAITPREITFIGDETHPSKTFISPIFYVTITVPETDPQYRGRPSPLVSFKNEDPIELTQVNYDKWVDNPLLSHQSIKEAAQKEKVRFGMISSALYLFIFSLIVGLIYLLQERRSR